MNCEILRHEKKDCRNSPFLVLSFAHSSFITFSYTNTETLYIITETLILSRKLPSVIITDFCLRVYTIRQKNYRTKVRTFTNIKTPLKTHGNNVTLKAM